MAEQKDKIEESTADQLVNVRTLSEVLGISSRSVQDFAKRGILQRAKRGLYPLGQNTRAYIAYLRREGHRGETDLDAEQLRLKRAQADQLEIKNERARQESCPVDLFSVVTAKIAVQIAGILDQIPMNVKRKAPGASAAVIDCVKVEVVKAQNLCDDVDEVVKEAVDEFFRADEKNH